MTALRRPGELFRSISPWIVAARVIRLAAIGCFLTAVGLPATLAGVLVVMAIQGGVGSGGPASAAVRIAVLAASLPAALGIHSVSVETATTLTAAAQVGPMIANLTISMLVLALTLRTVSPRRVLAFVTSR
jgi:hypothetical protein